MYSEPLEVSRVAYKYPSSDHDVLLDLSWAAAPGDRIGFFGPNGSGKTTALDLVSGVLHPRAGKILLGGRSVARCPRSIARIDADFDMFEYLTLGQNVDFFLRFYGRRIERARQSRMFDRYDLARETTVLAAHASRGMRRKTQIVVAMLLAPALLVADEPLDGLDEVARERWFEDLRTLSALGTISVVALHDRALLEQHMTSVMELAQPSVATPAAP